MVLCPRRLQISVRSPQPGVRGGKNSGGPLAGNDQPSVQSPAPPQPWDNAKGISLNAALWNAQPRTKTMSAESGLATAHLLAPDFVRFQLSAQASQKGESRAGKQSVGLFGGCGFGDINRLFESRATCAPPPRTQPTASQLPQKTVGNKTTKQGKREKKKTEDPRANSNLQRSFPSLPVPSFYHTCKNQKCD